jgi:segregation and condensation protein A
MAHEVKLEVFEGPIDLLLHLITRQRVDIYEVSLASITEDYLAAVAGAASVDLEKTTGFLVVAATLLELKSARLLPSPSAEPEDAGLLEERDLLLARLIECATYREAGAWIAAGLETGEAFVGRSVGLEPEYEGLTPDVLARVTIEDLGRAASVALAPKPTPVLDVSHVQPITASVRDAILDVSEALGRGGRRSFEELCAGVSERIEVVVRFLALLELFKAGAVELEQGVGFGAIMVTWTGQVDGRAVVDEAEEYVREGPA